MAPRDLVMFNIKQKKKKKKTQKPNPMLKYFYTSYIYPSQNKACH
jgi:hypothetical protein